MRTIASVWSDPEEWAPHDRIAACVRELLRANAKLADWTSDRIYLAGLIWEDRQGTTPDIQIAAVDHEEELRPGSQSVLKLSVAIALRYPTADAVLQDFGPSIATVRAEVERCIYENPLLLGLAYSRSSLVRRFEGLAPTSANVFDEDGMTVSVLTLRATWEATIGTAARQ